MSNIISGWYETDYGTVMFHVEDIKTLEDLAQNLYLDHPDMYGADFELEGEYADGSDVNDTINELLQELDFLNGEKP